MSKKGVKESTLVSCISLITEEMEEQSMRNIQKVVLDGLQSVKIREDTSSGKVEQNLRVNS